MSALVKTALSLDIDLQSQLKSGEGAGKIPDEYAGISGHKVEFMRRTPALPIAGNLDLSLCTRVNPAPIARLKRSRFHGRRQNKCYLFSSLTPPT
jgi:hypothetical protein